VNVTLVYKNALGASHEGGTWNLLYQSAEVDGPRVTGDDESDLLDKVAAEDRYQYYWDNVVVFGFPDKTVKIGPNTYGVEELAADAGWDSEAGELRVSFTV
jgi:hypothetical protein